MAEKQLVKSKKASADLEEYAPPPRKEKAPPKLTAEEIAERRAAQEKYGRGEKVNLKVVKDKKLRGNLKKLELRYRDAALQAKDSELLLQEEAGFIQTEGMERTFKLSQEELKKEVDLATAQKSFELKLPTFGPYYIDYTRTGRYLLIGGRKGHVAAFDWREGKLLSEVHHRETVRDVKWLHNESFYAVSQKKYVYIYDTQGVEIHKLDKHIEVLHMEFLPYHFLLATVGNAGYLKYQDTSTGKLVAEIPTRLGTPTAMTQNKYNAIIHIGHGRGTVSLWSPNSTTPLVKLLTNKGPVTSIAIDREGRYMVTGGQDKKMSIWDLRMYKELHYYLTPAPPAVLDISDTGLLGVGWSTHVTVWKDALRTRQRQPYMTHHAPGSQINDLRFCPFEDVLGYGHEEGLGSLVIPGAGEANFDALEVNPYESKKERRETEVKLLLNKLQPDMISLDPDHIGQMDRRSEAVKKHEQDAEEQKMDKAPEKEKNKMRGKNSAGKRYIRKMKKRNIMDEKRLKYEMARDEKQRQRAGLPSAAEKLGPALARFTRPPLKA
ncbi:WD40-repeat-containing domain protein [Kalaharituber pfeilii]|nr:WD40-repeat-containing domain protein [Kalaharituber pfeilii]